MSITVDGRWAYEEVQIVDGEGVTIKDFNPYLSATSTNYVYEITKSDKDGYVIISTVDYEDDPTKNPETLKVMHQSTSNRTFTVNSNNPHYMVLSNLGEMGSGEFYVTGTSGPESVIDANNLWTLFNADSSDGVERELEISSIKIQNAVINVLSGRENGAALYVNGEKSTVKTNAVVFESNASVNGGAIYNNGGDFSMLSNVLSNNSASNDGGAVFLNNGINKIENTEFLNNTANRNAGALYSNSTEASVSGSYFESNTAASGGAVYNENVLTITDTEFTQNTATGSGGAIYNKGTLNLTTTDNGTNRFSGNSAQSGGDIYNDNGTINFNGGGITEITSGIAGTGVINKNDAGELNLKGNNNDFSGTVEVNGGKIVFDKTSGSER